MALLFKTIVNSTDMQSSYHFDAVLYSLSAERRTTVMHKLRHSH